MKKKNRKKKDNPESGIFRGSHTPKKRSNVTEETEVYGPKRGAAVKQRLELKAKRDLEMAAKIHLKDHRIPAEYMESAKYEDVETARRAVETKFSGTQGWPNRMSLEQKRAYVTVILRHGREAAFNLAEADIAGSYDELRSHVKKKKW